MVVRVGRGNAFDVGSHPHGQRPLDLRRPRPRRRVSGSDLQMNSARKITEPVASRRGTTRSGQWPRCRFAGDSRHRCRQISYENRSPDQVCLAHLTPSLAGFVFVQLSGFGVEVGGCVGALVGVGDRE